MRVYNQIFPTLLESDAFMRKAFFSQPDEDAMARSGKKVETLGNLKEILR